MKEIFQIGRIERFPLRTPYTAVVERVTELVRRCGSGVELVVDATGVGVAVVDLFHACGVAPIAVSITAGTVEGGGGGAFTVPKLLLISKLDALIATRRLKIHADLPEADVLINELKDYQVQYTPSGQLTANARQGKHDDIILATALAIWRLSGGGMTSWGFFELGRQRAAQRTGASQEKLVIGLDLGKSADPTALVVARRVVDLPNPVSQPESTAPPPVIGSAEWQHQLAEDLKIAARATHGLPASGPLKPAPTFSPKPRR